MRDVAEVLAELADHPPTTPRPVPEIAATVRHRRRWRRARLGAAIASVVVVALIAGAVVMDGGQENDDVRISPHPDRPLVGEIIEAPFDPDIAVTEPHGLTVEPSTGLRDGDEVRVHLEMDTIPAVCAAEVVALAANVPETRLPWCASPREDREDGILRVARTIRTPEGLVDCAMAPGRCVVVSSWLRSGDLDYAPIAFASGLPPVSDGRVKVWGATDGAADGQRVRVEGEGFQPGVAFRVGQCRGEVGFDLSELCEGDVRGRTVQADADGSFSIELLLYYEVGTTTAPSTFDGGVPFPEWPACEPCALWVDDWAGVSIQIPIDMVPPTATPVRPSIDIVTPGPYAPGQTVTLEGAGLQIGQDESVRLALCSDESLWLFALDDSECVARELPPVVADRDGNFVVEGFTMPNRDEDPADCADLPNGCALVLAVGYNLVAEVIPLDLSG